MWPPLLFRSLQTPVAHLGAILLFYLPDHNEVILNDIVSLGNGHHGIHTARGGPLQALRGEGWGERGDGEGREGEKGEGEGREWERGEEREKGDDKVS